MRPVDVDMDWASSKGILRGVIHSSGIMLDKKITPRDLVFLVGGGIPRSYTDFLPLLSV